MGMVNTTRLAASAGSLMGQVWLASRTMPLGEIARVTGLSEDTVQDLCIRGRETFDRFVTERDNKNVTQSD